MSVTAFAGTTETIQEFFARFGAGDLPALLELFTEEVDWNVPGADTVPWTGRRSTKDELTAFFVSAGEEVEATEQFEVDRIVAEGDTGVAIGRFTHVIRRTGKRFSSEFALHIAVVDGRIRLYHMFEDGHAAAEAFAA